MLFNIQQIVFFLTVPRYSVGIGFRFLRKREVEITHIVESIQDLNTVFKELAQMVSEQVSYCKSMLDICAAWPWLFCVRVIPHSRRIFYVRQVARIVDITLRSRGIILIIGILMKLWTNSTLFSVQILQECGLILLLGGRKCNYQNYFSFNIVTIILIITLLSS